MQEVSTTKAYYNTDKARVIASGDFTDQAVRLARSNGVDLWDRAHMGQELFNQTGRDPGRTSAGWPCCPRCGSLW